MKKIILLLSIAMFSFASMAQDYTIATPGKTTQIFTTDTLASAGADTVDLYMKTFKGEALKYSLQVISTNVSGTSEGYVDVYKSNSLTDGWELVATRVLNDTLTSSNLVGWRSETTGFEADYLRLIITNKTQTQSTAYNAFILPYK